ALLEARERALFRLVEPQIVGEQLPGADRPAGQTRALDGAVPAEEARQRPPRNAVRHQEIEVLLKEEPREGRRHVVQRYGAYVHRASGMRDDPFTTAAARPGRPRWATPGAPRAAPRARGRDATSRAIGRRARDRKSAWRRRGSAGPRRGVARRSRR